MDVTVVIPTHLSRSRSGMLDRALGSVTSQERLPNEVVVIYDHDGEGACVTRNRGLCRTGTEWVAFLDSDDAFYPMHLKRLLETASDTDADIVYPWFDVIGGRDPLRAFGEPFNPDRLQKHNYIPITLVAKTELLKDVGGFKPVDDGTGCANEDWGCWLRCLNVGAKFVHLPEKTWAWYHHGRNTSGRPDWGDAIGSVPNTFKN